MGWLLDPLDTFPVLPERRREPEGDAGEVSPAPDELRRALAKVEHDRLGFARMVLYAEWGIPWPELQPDEREWIEKALAETAHDAAY